MNSTIEDLVNCIELHDVQGIRECFEHGVDPNDGYRDAPLIDELTSEYTRSPRFKDCVKAFVEAGLMMEDKVLLAVLLDDAESLEELLRANSSVIGKKYTLRCAYTPMQEVSLLHICAEFNHVNCAEVLISHGVTVNITAGSDEWGFGGQTPIFHTVNQNNHRSAAMMELLLSYNADLSITVPGLIWGKGYEWETLVPSLNPISYAMMGLLPQMHRDENTITQTVSLLLKKAYGITYQPANVPNKYLQS